ncbi:MAG TPA: transporter substrate-binding domain-containing protein [Spirochaetia bacterium]|nr:transporter substrate-binding domain-containing protein [Spirochaetia bacterium]
MKVTRFPVYLVLAILFAAFAVSAVTAQDSPAVKAIKDRGVLRVGVKVDVPKFGYRDPATGVVDGYEIDLARAVAAKILGDPTKIDLTAVTAKTRGPLLDNGEVDMVIATFTITDERRKSYNFSDPYFVDGVGLMVKKSSGYTSFRDLNGKRIGVAQSATSKKAVEDEAANLGIRVNFSQFNTYPEIRAALDSGRVDCFSVDTSILWGYMDNTTMLLPERFSPQPYGIATKFDNKGLAALVNDLVAQLKASGQNDTLLVKWGLK